MTFTTTALVDNRVLVQGTDFLGVDGKTVLDSSQWLEVNKATHFKEATNEFDAAVKEFFAPLTEASDKLEAIQKGDAPDPVTFVVLDEETKAVPGKPAHLVKLTKDSIILRLLEQGASDRLAWVNEELEIIASPSQATLPVDEAAVLSKD
jgi:hypothetical protein